MNPKIVKQIIKKTDTMVDLLDTQIEQMNGIIDSVKEYQEFLEDEMERLKSES
jgi:hypothetical protein